MDKYSSWIGLGFKGGGFGGIMGVEYVSGTLRNLGFLSEHHDFQLMNARSGIGLGGSVGTIICIVYHCQNLWKLNGTWNTDWSVNVAIGEKWDTIAKGLKNYSFLSTLGKLNDITKTTPADIENIRNGMSYLYTMKDIAGMDKNPKLVTIDVPGAGVGYEVSAFVSAGKIEILD